MKHHSTKSRQRVNALRRLLLGFESLEDRRVLAVDLPPPPLDSEPPQVLDTSFMDSGSLSAGTASIDVTFSETVIGADNVATYELRRAGADGLLLSSDPVMYPTSITINNNTATLVLPNAIGKDTYRLTIKASITDIAGNVLLGTDPSIQGEDWRSDFVGSGILVPPIQLASADQLGTQGNQVSKHASMSSDGRYIAFQSFSSNLVANDTNGFADVFVKDTVTNAITRVSTDSFGNESNGESSVSSISADGRYVAFQSSAKNLVTGDTNNSQDVFIKDLRTGTTIRVSTDSQGLQGNNTSFEPSISADGRYVAFQSFASNLVAGDTNRFWDVFVKDITTGLLVRASTDSLGSQVLSDSFDPVISADGKFVSFYSYSNNLVSGDSNNTLDVFIKSLQTGLTTRVSTDTNGVQGNSFSYSPSINSSGRYIAFQSFSSNLVPGDTNGAWDVFLKDTLTGSLTSVSKNSSGVQGNGSSSAPSISIDGRYVVFQSMASNLVENDTNGTSDIFVSDTQTGQIARLSIDSSSLEGNNDSVEAYLSSDGRYITFTSFASNLSSTDTNEVQDVFITANPFFVPVSQVGPLSSPNGFTFDVDAQSANAGQLINGLNNSFDGYNRLKVNGVDFSAFTESTFEDSDRTILTSTTRMSGLDVHREVTVPSMGAQDFVRTIDVFTNTSGTSITVPVGLVGNVGSDVKTNVFATSDGDLIVEPTDTWFGTDDDKPNGGTPAIIHLLQTDFALRTPAASIGVVEDNVTWAFNLTVPAGQTRRLASFAIQGTTRQQAISSTTALIGSSGFAEQSGVFLTSEELQTLANFQFSRAPNDIEFTLQSFFENNLVNATVGTLSTLDANTPFGDTFTYSLVSGIGSNDNSAFTIQDNELRASKVFDYEEKPSYSIRVRTTDAAGLFTEKQIGILVADMDEIPPFVSTSSIPATGVITAGAMTLSITFSESGMDASNPLQYELRRAGADGLLLDTDTAINPASVSYSGSTVSLTFSDPFTIDTYRLTIRDSAVDSANNALDGNGDGISGGDWEQDFVVAPNAISLVSFSTSGVHANGPSDSPSASYDGRLIAFSSLATNLVAYDNNGFSDIYVRDQKSQAIQLASASSTGLVGNGASFDPILSADGRFVVFRSEASNLVPDDNNNLADLFVKDLQTNDIYRVSTDSNGAEGNGDSDSAVISSEGRFVVFTSSSSNFSTGDSNPSSDIFVKDRLTGAISLVSSDTNGIQGNGASYRPSLSHDGRYVAFLSAASNLVSNDSNNAIDVFVKDLQTGKLTRISTSTINTESDGNSDSPSISIDGRYVSFTSTASNLVDGSPVGRWNIYVKDTATDILKLVSTNVFDVPANLDSLNPGLSIDGRYVAFESVASNLIDGDTNGLTDVFVKDLKLGEVRRVSASSLGAQGDGSSFAPSFSGDGTSIVFAGEATNLLPREVGNLRNSFQVKNPMFGNSDSEFFTSSTQFNWDVASTGFTGQINQGPNGAFDGMNRLEVGGERFVTNVPSTWINSGKTLATPTVLLSDIDLRRETTVSSISTVDFARTINVFHNATNSSITQSVRFFGNLGSDKETNVFATSDGDLLVEPTDSWFATDDADPDGGTPAIVHLIRSGTGIRPTYLAVYADNVDWTYNITLNPGETTRLASFTFLGTSRQSVLDAMEAITLPGGSDLIPEAYAYLSLEEISTIANFQSNPAPTDILLSNTTITENESVPALIGILSTVDESNTESYSYSLVDGEGSDDNSSFLLLNGQLFAQDEFDFESKSSYTIRLRSTDQGGAWVERVFEIQVLDANDPPRVANPLPDLSVLEDSVDTVIDLSELFTDDHAGVSLTVNSSNPSIVTTTLNGTLLTITYPANAFGKAIVSVSATDIGNLTSSDTFFLEVQGVNDAPALVNPIEDVDLLEFGTPLSIDISNRFHDADDENLVLTVTSSDPGLLSAQIVNSKLELSGLPRSNGTVEVSVLARDHAGLQISDIFLVTLQDPRPELTITGPSDGFLGITGQTRQFQFVTTKALGSSNASFSYEILWGDGSPPESIPGASLIDVEHAYWTPGVNRIQARTLDHLGNASEWVTLDVDIQRYELQNEVLMFGGTPNNDQYVVALSAGQPTLSISLNNQALGIFSATTRGISLNGYTGNDQIIFNGTMSDDLIEFEGQRIRWSGITDSPNRDEVSGGSIERFLIQTIGGNDKIRVISGAVEVDGGSGADILQGPNTGADWIVNGVGTGTLQGSSFKYIETIQGGLGDDTFAITGTGFLLGGVDGKEGLDTIDYSQRTTAVDVNLALEKATGTGRMVNVERFIGSESAFDRLSAPNIDNQWHLTDFGYSTLGNSTTFQGFENLYGGTLSDRFVIDPSATNIPKLIGGRGIDSLDYALWDLPVTIQRQTRSATSVPYFASIENFIGGNGADTMVGVNYNTTWRLTGNHSGTFSSTGSFSHFEKIIGGSSSDHFVVDDSFQGDIVGGGGDDVLTGPLQNNVWQLDGFQAGRLNDTLAFSEMEDLRGNASDDTFLVANNSNGFRRIVGGQGFDQLNYSEWNIPISVGHTIAPGVNMFGAIESIVGTNGSDTIVGADTHSNWIVSAKDVVLSHSVTFQSFENIDAGSLNDQFTLNNPGSFLSGTINGGGGIDTLNGSSPSNIWSLTGYSIGLLNGVQSFMEIENLNGGQGDDRYQFASTASGFGRIHGGAGYNSLDFSATSTPLTFNLDSAASGILENFFGIDLIVGTSSNLDTLIGRNRESQWIIGGSLGNRVGGIQFSSFEWLQGGSENDNFSIQDSIPIQVDGGEGVDSIVGPAVDSKWRISGAGTGAIDDSLHFRSMENIYGGQADDVVIIEPLGSVPNLLNGGRGLNTLSYAGWSNDVEVNGILGTATAVQNLASNFQIIIGGSGNDRLTAFNFAGSVLVGNTGDDILTGRIGRTLLFGGLGADQLIGTRFDDLISAGPTSFDNDAVALKAIRAEWQSVRNYAQRVGNIRGNSVTGPSLNGPYYLANTPADRIFDDSAVDSLFGGLGSDWFIQTTQDGSDRGSKEMLDDPS